MSEAMWGIVGAFGIQLAVFFKGYGRLGERLDNLKEDMKDIKAKCNSLVNTNGSLSKDISGNTSRISRLEGEVEGILGKEG